MGKIVTFYSYKGGVGRSMAVANVGAVLADRVMLNGERVLLIDWDLEAPGLQTFFADPTDYRADLKPGLLEYFQRVRAGITDDIHRRLPYSPQLLEQIAPLAEFLQADVFGNLDLMPAGVMSPTFSRQVAEFDWSAFWNRWPYVFSAFRELLANRYKWVLIDSRTGLNDVSGICTAIMPEKLVVVFALTNQHLTGATRVIENASTLSVSNSRPETAFRVPSSFAN